MLIAPSVEDSCSLFSSIYWHLSFCGKTNGVGRADQSVLASEDRIKSLSGAYEGIMEEVEVEMEEWGPMSTKVSNCHRFHSPSILLNTMDVLISAQLSLDFGARIHRLFENAWCLKMDNRHLRPSLRCPCESPLMTSSNSRLFLLLLNYSSSYLLPYHFHLVTLHYSIFPSHQTWTEASMSVLKEIPPDSPTIRRHFSTNGQAPQQLDIFTTKVTLLQHHVL
ncbi:unnamed protein product [Rodentolepis nana]|uniref:Uncharacterized protein n=1 Tax=Rodentolepis nana TaxID=102285 RepID=A0A0R3U0Y1_RODNA|nr:unnamed protein product [Rodentolepis nana]